MVSLSPDQYKIETFFRVLKLAISFSPYTFSHHEFCTMYTHCQIGTVTTVDDQGMGTIKAKNGQGHQV
jgi:hypothetical protein